MGSDMKETLEQLVMEKAQATQSAKSLTHLLICLTVKNDGEIRLSKADWDKAEGYGIKLERVGKTGTRIVATEAE